jgi:hypothetical protein
MDLKIFAGIATPDFVGIAMAVYSIFIVNR